MCASRRHLLDRCCLRGLLLIRLVGLPVRGAGDWHHEPVPASSELPIITPPDLDSVLTGLSRNPCAPADVLLRLTAADIDRCALARRRDLPSAAARVLAGDQDSSVRWELASSPCLPPEVQAVLAVDPDARVRGRLAEGAEYFTTVGVHGRQIPQSLTREVYELLSHDPEPKVRRTLAFNRHLPNDLRSLLLAGTDARTAGIAATEWMPTPVDRIDELLRVTGTFGRSLLLMRLDCPLPTDAAHVMLADLSASINDGSSKSLLRDIAKVADLDADLTHRFLTNPDSRAAVAANPTLPAEHIGALARDPDNYVRAAIVARRDLDPVLRESIPVEYDDRSSGIVSWLLTDDLPETDRLTFAQSRHQIFRKTLAMRQDLPDEIVEILAHDDSFAVRLFVCERQPNAPGWLLAQIAAQWTSYSRWDMLAHKNFPAAAATRLAQSDNPHDRVVAAAHPGLAVEAIEALLTDNDAAVRRRAATNPAIPIIRLIALLCGAERDLAEGAAANGILPAPTMRQILDQAAL